MESTRFFLKEAERVSGRPVVVQEDPTIQRLATVQTARGTAPMHVIKYRPVPNSTPDYHLCYRCGYILRLFENPREDRFSLATGPDASKVMDALLGESHISPQLRAAKDSLLGSLLTQLRSIPVGLRIDDLIWDHHPDLLAGQVASARSQMAENVKALAPEIRHAFPLKLIRANTAMNAVFANFWSGKIGDQTVRIPYQSVGAEADGMALMKIFEHVGVNSDQDWNLVDRWGEFLGLTGWYKWVRHELEP